MNPDEKMIKVENDARLNPKSTEAKYYKLFRSYYRVIGDKIEHVMAYKHKYGVVTDLSVHFETIEMVEITEVQYNRVKKIIIKKLLS